MTLGFKSKAGLVKRQQHYVHPKTTYSRIGRRWRWRIFLDDQQIDSGIADTKDMAVFASTMAKDDWRARNNITIGKAA